MLKIMSSSSSLEICVKLFPIPRPNSSLRLLKVLSDTPRIIDICWKTKVLNLLYEYGMMAVQDVLFFDKKDVG